MSDEDLKQLLQEAQAWNESHNLTGMLLYIRGAFLGAEGGRFIQVLEGTKKEVVHIFKKIKVDERHYNVNLLNQADLEKRHFKTWSMGFNALNHDDFKKMEGYFDPDSLFNSNTKNNVFNVPLSYLKSFYSLHNQSRKAG